MLGRKLVVLSLLTLMALPTACIAPITAPITAPIAETGASQDTLFQTSTLSKLSAGAFDGTLSIAELKQHGDFGVGTFNALDGEMVVLDGQVYRAMDDGTAQLVDDATLTPFAVVTYFAADETIAISETMDCPQIQAQIDSQLPTLDAPYAVKISGTFDTLKVRVPHAVVEPYPATLADALADQVLFESTHISGTMVGFRLPDYMAGANSAGYHFHFISDDKLSGGHVLECQSSALTIEVDTIDKVYMELPTTVMAE